jgi:hypothetical protein
LLLKRGIGAGVSARGHAAHTHGIAKVSEWARLLRRLLVDAAADDCGVDYTLN